MPIDLSRLTLQKLPTESVSVPEWAELIGTDTLVVGCLTSAERGQFENGTPDKSEDSAKTIVARFVAWCLREPEGGRMYLEPELASQHLAAADNRVLRRLFKAAKRVNGEGEEAMKTAEKNSESGQT
jgi:hypothetical protein